MKTWVIGATSGIGKSCATVLASAGYDVSPSGAECDVRDRDILAAYAEKRGPFEALVYSAGIHYIEWSEQLDTEVAKDVYNVNVLGLVRVLQVCPGLKRVVVIGSDAAWRPMRTSLAYNASKAALHAAVQVIARERAAEDFAINVIAPGLVHKTAMTNAVVNDTRLVRGWTEEATWDYMIPQIPMGRPAQPVEIAYVVRDILEAPFYLNGAIIAVNGGR